MTQSGNIAFPRCLLVLFLPDDNFLCKVKRIFQVCILHIIFCGVIVLNYSGNTVN